jgi:hypothetical protein
MKTLRNTIGILSAAAALALVGCAAPEFDADESMHESESAATTTENGLNSINGLSSVNGLTSVNGLSSVNGLASVNGLSSVNGLMTTTAGRNTVSYLIRCALPAGRSITKKDQTGKSYTYAGQLGFAPEWETGACGIACQEYMTACMMAHVNTTGIHVPLWLDAAKSNIGWGQSSLYPNQEGSFFGNIFVSPPKAYYCEGRGFAQGVVPGRIGATQVGAPYVNPFAGWASLFCKDTCTPQDAPNQNDGYKACMGYNNIVTVFRK